MTAYVRALWTNGPKSGAYIESVHRLNDLGAVFVNVLKGSSTEGFDAESRMIELMTVEGDLISRAELFDESDWTSRSHASMSCLDQLRGWRTRQAKWPNSFGCTSRPTTGTR